MNILEVQNIHVAYGESEVCHDVSFHVNQGEILCILGRNGVGKTTSMKAIMASFLQQRAKSYSKGRTSPAFVLIRSHGSVSAMCRRAA